MRIATLLLLCLIPIVCWAGVDVNQATEAQLDGIRGIGPGLSGRILQERHKAPFRDWNDLIGRVGGVGKTTAARISAEGLTVNGQGYDAPAPRAAAPRTGARPSAPD